MKIECGECSDFVDLTESRFGETFQQYRFQPVRCSSKHGGRECMLMLESEVNRLLFVRSDNAETCELGSLKADFPEAGLFGEGQGGWYHIVTLLQFKTGKKLLTRQRLNEFLEGREDHFAWQAKLLAQHAEVLFGMFRNGNESTWREEFQAYYSELIKG